MITLILYILTAIVVYRFLRLRSLDKKRLSIDPINEANREELAEITTKYNNLLKWRLFK